MLTLSEAKPPQTVFPRQENPDNGPAPIASVGGQNQEELLNPMEKFHPGPL